MDSIFAAYRTVKRFKVKDSDKSILVPSIQGDKCQSLYCFGAWLRSFELLEYW